MTRILRSWIEDLEVFSTFCHWEMLRAWGERRIKERNGRWTDDRRDVGELFICGDCNRLNEKFVAAFSF